MSTARNIAAHLWRGSIIRKANIVLGITGAALSAACAADQIAGPGSTPQGISASKGRHHMGDVSVDPRAPKEDPKKAANSQSKAQMDSLKQDWAAYKQAVKDGSVDEDFLRCEPKPEVSVTKKIGRKGGDIHVGPHTFSVPAGALDSDVVITAFAPTSSRAELKFAPHGLQFSKPVEMSISYKGCVVPENAELGVSYIDHPGQSYSGWKGMAAKKQPAHDDKTTTAVSALTDHFSGYVVSWARQ